MMLTKLIFKLRKLFSKQKVKALVVGVEKSKIVNNCVGAEKGANRFFNIIKYRCNYSKLLINENATKSNVISELCKVCQNSDLAIIVFCCHGGQQSGKQNEIDGKDEFVALYDKYLIDNEIWNVISQAKGRVFTIFDCCHAQTMFRDVLMQSRDNKPSVDLLCWSACADDKESFALPKIGGIFINSICSLSSFNETYESMWNKLSASEYIRKYEQIYKTILKTNSNFKNKKLFS